MPADEYFDGEHLRTEFAVRLGGHALEEFVDDTADRARLQADMKAQFQSSLDNIVTFLGFLTAGEGAPPALLALSTISQAVAEAQRSGHLYNFGPDMKRRTAEQLQMVEDDGNHMLRHVAPGCMHIREIPTLPPPVIQRLPRDPRPVAQHLTGPQSRTGQFSVQLAGQCQLWHLRHRSVWDYWYHYNHGQIMTTFSCPAAPATVARRTEHAKEHDALVLQGMLSRK